MPQGQREQKTTEEFEASAELFQQTGGDNKVYIVNTARCFLNYSINCTLPTVWKRREGDGKEGDRQQGDR